MKAFFKATLITGLLAGTADLTAATISVWIRTGNFPSSLLHYIAGGALGLETSMAGGAGIALLGLFIHYFIAYSWTLFFFVIFPYVRFLSFNKYLAGLLYGVFVGAMMTFVVLPLTRLPDAPFVLQRALLAWAILAVALGLPIAIRVYKFYKVGPGTDTSMQSV
jgi:hypothetical protein